MRERMRARRGARRRSRRRARRKSRRRGRRRGREEKKGPQRGPRFSFIIKKFKNVLELSARGGRGRGVWECVPDPPGAQDCSGDEDLQTGQEVHRAAGEDTLMRTNRSRLTE